MFDFKYIRPFDKNLIKSTQPMVLFATPGMLHGGLSTQVFKEWCHEKKNTLIIPGYCVAGTLGNKLLTGVKSITIDKKEYEINMKIKNMSFSAHADAKGILQMIKHVQPKNVMLVHGEKKKMEFLSEIIKEYCQIPCFWPANFEKCIIDATKEKKDIVEIKQNFSLDLGVEKKHFSGFLVWNKLNEKKYFFTEEDFLDEINQLLMLLKSSFRIEPHLIIPGLCLKLNSSFLKKTDLKDNDLQLQIYDHFKNKNLQNLLDSTEISLENEILLIKPKTKTEKDKDNSEKIYHILKEI